MLVPFLASAFTGLFYAQTPNEFEAGEHIEFTTYFVVGDGDAASVLDVAYTLQDKKTGFADRSRDRLVHGRTCGRCLCACIRRQRSPR